MVHRCCWPAPLLYHINDVMNYNSEIEVSAQVATPEGSIKNHMAYRSAVAKEWGTHCNSAVPSPSRKRRRSSPSFSTSPEGVAGGGVGSPSTSAPRTRR